MFGVIADVAAMTALVALVFLFAIALVAAVTLVIAVMAVRRYPIVGLGAVGLNLITMWEVPNLPAIATVSGISIYPADAVTLVLFAVGLLEFAQLRINMRGWLLPWLLFGILIAVSTLRGIAIFGPGTAVNEARSLLYFFVVMTWVLATRPDRLRLHTFSLVLGWALVLVALYHAVIYGVGGAASAQVVGDRVQTGRILVGGQAQALLLCAGTVFLGPFGSKEARQRSTASSIVFLGVVVLAQHRSVWIAAALGMAAVLILSRRRRSRNQISALFAVGAWLALLVWSSGFVERFGSELIESALNSVTLDWRTSSWQSLISQAFDQGLAVVIGGEPFGGGYLRQLDTGRWTDEVAHNWYVTIFLRIGAIGLLIFAALLVSTLVKSRAVQAEWTFALAATAVFGFAYTVEWYLVPWMGLAMSVSLGRLPQSDRTGWGQEKRFRVQANERNPAGWDDERADPHGMRESTVQDLAPKPFAPQNTRTPAHRYDDRSRRAADAVR